MTLIVIHHLCTKPYYEDIYIKPSLRDEITKTYNV